MEELIESVKRSFTHCNGDGTITDHIDDPYDDSKVCAHCGSKIEPKCTGAKWRFVCDCDGAQGASQIKIDIMGKMRSLTNLLNGVERDAEKVMLETYKEVYRRRIPDRKKRAEKMDDRILSLTTEDLG